MPVAHTEASLIAWKWSETGDREDFRKKAHTARRKSLQNTLPVVDDMVNDMATAIENLKGEIYAGSRLQGLEGNVSLLFKWYDRDFRGKLPASELLHAVQLSLQRQVDPKLFQKMLKQLTGKDIVFVPRVEAKNEDFVSYKKLLEFCADGKCKIQMDAWDRAKIKTGPRTIVQQLLKQHKAQGSNLSRYKNYEKIWEGLQYLGLQCGKEELKLILRHFGVYEQGSPKRRIPLKEWPVIVAKFSQRFDLDEFEKGLQQICRCFGISHRVAKVTTARFAAVWALQAGTKKEKQKRKRQNKKVHKILRLAHTEGAEHAQGQSKGQSSEIVTVTQKDKAQDACAPLQSNRCTDLARPDVRRSRSIPPPGRPSPPEGSQNKQLSNSNSQVNTTNPSAGPGVPLFTKCPRSSSPATQKHIPKRPETARSFRVSDAAPRPRRPQTARSHRANYRAPR